MHKPVILFKILLFIYFVATFCHIITAGKGEVFSGEADKSMCSKINGGIWSPTTNQCFRFHQTKKTWKDSYCFCEKAAPSGFKGRLPVVPNQDVFDILKNASVHNFNFWIGLRTKVIPLSSTEAFFSDWLWYEGDKPVGNVTWTPKRLYIWLGMRHDCIFAHAADDKYQAGYCDDRYTHFCEFLKETPTNYSDVYCSASTTAVSTETPTTKLTEIPTAIPVSTVTPASALTKLSALHSPVFYSTSAIITGSIETTVLEISGSTRVSPVTTTVVSQTTTLLPMSGPPTFDLRSSISPEATTVVGIQPAVPIISTTFEPVTVNMGGCKVDTYSQWSNCDATCGPGMRQRWAISSTKGCQDVEKQSEMCSAICFKDCTWSEWSSWGYCSVSCGKGRSIRWRSSAEASQDEGGQPCNGSNYEAKDCVGSCIGMRSPEESENGEESSVRSTGQVRSEEISVETGNIGRAANFGQQGQSRLQVGPWAPGVQASGSKEILLGIPMTEQYYSATTVRMNVPLTPGSEFGVHRFPGIPPSASVFGTSWCGQFTRVPTSPIMSARSTSVPGEVNVEASTSSQTPTGNLLPIESGWSKVRIEELGPEKEIILNTEASGNVRAAGGGSPTPEPTGVQTRGQIKRQQQSKSPGNGVNPSVKGSSVRREKDVVGSETALSTDVSETAVKTPVTSDSGEVRSSATSASTVIKSSPENSELNRLLSQVTFEYCYDDEDGSDYKFLSDQLGERLCRATEIIKALVGQKRKLNDRCGDRDTVVKIQKNEITDLAITLQTFSEDNERLKERNKVVESQCEYLRNEFTTAQRKYSAIECLRQQQDQKFGELHQQYLDSVEKIKGLKNKIQEFEQEMSASHQEIVRLNQEMARCEISVGQTAEKFREHVPEAQMWKYRLGVYSQQALNPTYAFDPNHPPVNPKIVQMVQDLRGGGANVGRPPPPAQPSGLNISAQPFAMPAVTMTPVQATIPSTIASTQPATDSTAPISAVQQVFGAVGGNLPKLPKPRTFGVHRGGNCYMDFKKWTTEVRSYLVLTKVDPTLWVDCAVYYLEGFARELMLRELMQWRNVQNRSMNFEEFCAFMIDRVIPPRNPALAGVQLERIVYRSGIETLAAFKDKILDNLQTQKGDVPLSEVDLETAKVIFLNKLPATYKVFIYQQKWVMENPTLNNYQKAAEMYEASNDLNISEGRGRTQNFQFRSGYRGPRPFRSRSRTRNWNFNRRRNRGKTNFVK